MATSDKQTGTEMPPLRPTGRREKPSPFNYEIASNKTQALIMIHAGQSHEAVNILKYKDNFLRS
jgi:hypothetical protein